MQCMENRRNKKQNSVFNSRGAAAAVDVFDDDAE